MRTREFYTEPHIGRGGIERNPWKLKRSWLTLLMFVIGASSTFDFSLVGRVTLSEVIAFAFVPYFWLNKRESWINGNLIKCLWILALMFFGVIISDFILNNYYWFSARAFARPVFMLGFLLFFIPVLKRDPLSIAAMVYGAVLAGVIKYLRPSQFEDAGALDLESYAGIAFRVMPMIFAFIIALAVWVYPRSRLAAALCFVAGAASVVYFGGPRSSALNWMIAAGVVVSIWLLKSSRSRRINLKKGRLILLGFVALLVMTMTYFAYIYAAPRGYLGEGQEQKMLEQSRTVFGASPLGLILAGRPQFYGAVLGVIDSPIIGHGSWRHDLTSIYTFEAIASVGTDPRLIDMMTRSGGAAGAGHSVLMQAWVENGIVPAMALVAAMWIIFKVGLFSIRYENRMTPYFIYTIISFSWAFLFSPPGMDLRFSIGLFMAFYVVFMDKKKPLARMHVLP